MRSFSLRIEVTEILIVCATVLNLYEKTAFSYIVFCIGLMFAFTRGAYTLHLYEEGKKQKAKDVKELRAFLLKNGITTKSPPSSSGQLTH